MQRVRMRVLARERERVREVRLDCLCERGEIERGGELEKESNRKGGRERDREIERGKEESGRETELERDRKRMRESETVGERVRLRVRKPKLIG
jgi:hypothetical protein